MKGRAVLSILLLSGLALRCGSPTVAGGVTDSPNSATVAGIALYADSIPAAHATVRLRSADYAAKPNADSGTDSTVTAVDITTDSTGFYSIDGIEPASYYLEITDLSGYAFGTGVTVAHDTTLARAVLEPVISVGGNVSLENTTTETAILVQVVGLERVAVIEPGDSVFRFDDLPAGTHTLRLTTLAYESGERYLDVPSLDAGDSSLHNDMSLRPFDGENYTGWAHSRRIALTTTAEGASVDEDVYDFPVLIRLDSTTCDFTRFQPDGRDIRFSHAASGTRLPYQIDYWDAPGERAGVWVRVDTIRGNAVTELLMHWGNPSAPDLSHGPSVFDTAAGFAGVWHMDRVNDIVPEATGHGSHGTPLNYDDASVVDGIIGSGLAEDATRHRIEIPDAPHLRLGDGFTLSTWYKGRQYGHFINKYNSYVLYPHQGTYKIELQLGRDTIGTMHFVSSSLVPADTGWNYVAVTFDGTDFHWQVNDGYVTSDMPLLGTVVQDTTILSLQKTDLPMDEVRIESVRRSSAWLRLSYANQRADQRLVRFAP
jgi:biopolymer transport protein ExbB